ncbi:hypothetical protein BC828DRAFT_405380 [Blastocladiella britannica]|nr:hypothetical protein BC828DRAFT_405380 [Blastocladiella britannica]
MYHHRHIKGKGPSSSTSAAAYDSERLRAAADGSIGPNEWAWLPHARSAAAASRRRPLSRHRSLVVGSAAPIAPPLPPAPRSTSTHRGLSSHGMDPNRYGYHTTTDSAFDSSLATDPPHGHSPLPYSSPGPGPRQRPWTVGTPSSHLAAATREPWCAAAVPPLRQEAHVLALPVPAITTNPPRSYPDPTVSSTSQR